MESRWDQQQMGLVGRELNHLWSDATSEEEEEEEDEEEEEEEEEEEAEE